MTRYRFYTLILILLNGLIMTAQDDGFKTSWNNGFKVENEDGDFAFQFGGRIMYDLAYFNQDDAVGDLFGDITSGAEFRRVRFFGSGKVYKNVKYKLEFNFSSGKVTTTDAYIELTHMPIIGNIRLGHVKEPFRLEALTSSKYLTFMERSFVAPFVPVRNTGLLVINETKDKRLGWQIGLFRNADDYGEDKSAGSSYNFTARVSGLLIGDTESRKLVHVGLAYSHRSNSEKTYRVRSRPSAHLAPRYVDTGIIENADGANLFNAELVFLLGSLSVQGEYIASSVDMLDGESLSAGALYGQVSYFLTGESRKYKNSYSGFGRVKPKNNFGNGEGGAGAWEIGLRYTTIDLDNGDLTGDVMNEWTMGINWHLNPAALVMINYVLADVQDVGNANIFQMRFQVDF